MSAASPAIHEGHVSDEAIPVSSASSSSPVSARSTPCEVSPRDGKQQAANSVAPVSAHAAPADLKDTIRARLGLAPLSNKGGKTDDGKNGSNCDRGSDNEGGGGECASEGGGESGASEGAAVTRAGEGSVGWSVCDGCFRCWAYEPVGNARKCRACGCAGVCHVAPEGDGDDPDEDYEALYGGGEDW